MKTIDAGRVVGRSAYDDAVLQGYAGSLTEWLESLKGDEGKSAYQSWLDAGNTGTEEDFLATLKADATTDIQEAIDNNVGAIADLRTTTKVNTVAAINELYESLADVETVLSTING